MQGRCNSDSNARSVTIMITDSCPECEADHLDIQVGSSLCCASSYLILCRHRRPAPPFIAARARDMRARDIARRNITLLVAPQKTHLQLSGPYASCHNCMHSLPGLAGYCGSLKLQLSAGRTLPMWQEKRVMTVMLIHCLATPAHSPGSQAQLLPASP